MESTIVQARAGAVVLVARVTLCKYVIDDAAFTSRRGQTNYGAETRHSTHPIMSWVLTPGLARGHGVRNDAHFLNFVDREPRVWSAWIHLGRATLPVLGTSTLE